MNLANDLTGGAMSSVTDVANQLGKRVSVGLDILARANGDPTKVVTFNSIEIGAQVRGIVVLFCEFCFILFLFDPLNFVFPLLTGQRRGEPVQKPGNDDNEPERSGQPGDPPVYS